MIRYDVIVVGLGPGGALASFELSRQGYRVLALERMLLPRYITCGGGLSIRASRLIPFDFTDQVEQTIHGVTFNFRGADPFTIESNDPIAFMVNRERFDYMMVSKAEQMGTFILDGVEVCDWTETDEGITVQTTKGEWHCRYLIGADGIGSQVRSKIFRVHSREMSVGFESDIPFHGLIEETHSLAQVDLGSAPYGVGWLFPKKNHHATGISGLQSRVKNLGEMYGQFIENQGILKEASGQQVHAYHRPPPMGRIPLHHGRALLVGDAAGLIDPFSGEGIYYAMQSALVAAEIISEALLGRVTSLSSYSARMLAEVADEFKSARRFSRLIYGWPETSYRFLQTHKWVLDLFFEILRGKERYDHVYDVVRGEWFSFAWKFWLNKLNFWRKMPVPFWQRSKEQLLDPSGGAKPVSHERRAHKRP